MTEIGQIERKKQGNCQAKSRFLAVTRREIWLLSACFVTACRHARLHGEMWANLVRKHPKIQRPAFVRNKLRTKPLRTSAKW